MNENISKISDIHRPLVEDETVLVPCIVEFDGNYTYITPIYDCLHDDKESGQDYQHWHMDYRFIPHDKEETDGIRFAVPHNTSLRGNDDIIWGYTTNGILPNDRPMSREVQWRPLRVVDPTAFENPTPPSSVKTKRMKTHICNGKCPHKGFDLTQVAAVDGVITCPLHGLRFDEVTKMLLQ